MPLILYEIDTSRSRDYKVYLQQNLKNQLPELSTLVI